MSLKLYEIADKYEKVLSLINEHYDENGEISEKALAKLDEITDVAQNKVIAVSCFIKNLEAERNAIKSAKEAMIKREKHLAKEEASLLDYLKFNMERCGITEISSSPYFKIKLKECPLSVDEDTLDMDLLPDEYKRTKIEVSPDKLKIIAETKEGVIIPGVTLKRNKKVEIK